MHDDGVTRLRPRARPRSRTRTRTRTRPRLATPLLGCPRPGTRRRSNTTRARRRTRTRTKSPRRCLRYPPSPRTTKTTTNHLATVNVHDVSKHSTNSSEASPALCGLPMGSVTEDVAANMAADLAAAVAADQAKNIAGGAGGASASASASASSNDGDDHTMAMDLGYTTMLPTRQ